MASSILRRPVYCKVGGVSITLETMGECGVRGNSEAIYLVRGSVWSISFLEPNKPDRPERPNEPDPRPAISHMLEAVASSRDMLSRVGRGLLMA